MTDTLSQPSPYQELDALWIGEKMDDLNQLTTEEQLEERLSRPTSVSLAAMRRLQGGLLVLGAGGKMGPSLVRLARRSAEAAGKPDLRVCAVSRFSNPAIRRQLEQQGIETVACDLLDPTERAKLPDLPNVLLMVGHKFSGKDLPGQYWAMNTMLPGLLAEQYHQRSIVCFSSGNVYPFTRLGQPHPDETVAAQPRGEYATTVWGRERILEFISSRYGTPVCLLRLNYAVEPRYGVLVDLGKQILGGREISLAVPELSFLWQGHANSVALASFQIAATPAAILNLAGDARHRVRDLAAKLAERLGRDPVFSDEEGSSSLLSDAARCTELFGTPELDADQLVEWTARWLLAEGKTLDKPTHFQVTNGAY